MKILHIMGMFSKKFGGLEHFMLALKEADPSICHIFAYNSMPSSADYLNKIGKIEIVPLGGLNNFKELPHFIKLLRKERPDVVHFHFESAFALWSRVAKLFGVKKVFKTEHSCIYVNGRQVEDISELNMRYRLITFGKKAYKAIDKVLAVSKFVENQLNSIYCDNIKTQTSYIGIDEPRLSITREAIRQKLNVEPNEILVATTLFANPIKGCDLLIEAFSKINNKDAKLMIIGLNDRASYTDYIKKLIREKNLGNRIIDVGITNHVTDYLAGADMYVQPSRSEALSLSCVEAASLALPTIGSKAGGLPEIAGMIYDIYDTTQLAKIIDELCADENKRRAEGLRSRQRYEINFRIKSSAAKYIELYKQC